MSLSLSGSSGRNGLDLKTDIWLTPEDTRLERASVWSKIWDSLVIGASLCIMVAGFSVILGHDWSSRQEDFVFWYVLASMTLELGCVLITGVGMLVIVTCAGQTGLIHALSTVSIFNEVLFVVAYTITAIWGGLTIHRMLERCDFDFRNYFYTQDHTEIMWNKVPIVLYVCFSFLVSCIYTMAAVPGFIGVIGFALHQVKNMIHPSIVQFYTQYNRGDEFYVRVMPVEDLAEYVTRMDNPIPTIGTAAEKESLLGPSRARDLEMVV
eukprot:Protomagalhaensia_sp_Gyna_25__202@NODE_1097_length_2194_cov_64_613457_g867_i0_p1_GENE_NODE_1097_length_2194_cov_64_613457_g867_i0NODE_1097_length_2194_cov_64_613457_g867_i0_p1_ORF_typecomplete_len266_score32_37SAYSvFN/PF10260_9/3_4e03SAYSvFN/PF10260_9/0_14SAYSvFN/PF10260_9/7_4e03TssN/PF17555_2/0_59_NODE_1097_length_2194_cov_64_613457_g867_i013452142